ncbi:ABC transporter, ATP-binding and permease protein [Pediococcus damnosus]|uniref:ABC transporter, ATP-binding and permease protein n=1 Tax=Pediococcus damnosus TaxID=51663 RepID=A0A143AP31_9LACO|nr:ABC transporter transmembrane domain-containing protein [Pediococcus damnosus]AMV61635.1 ABC transporter, ATP-binding and permease protein [Pediococcus damnosus]AMV62003.1 ABC transporter, ATP-binding and permease protein [Pediococcus damnosus]AMV65997.1 ABC transporter, ATP-binding and permease protein [Pediococcus damnosus]AMV68146.1 ABC transporter, ATP-binding and permease protein [Pediococcus damnosus]AMV70332.1 ABC transporter, ATP-binding and permease protein [Pediococcus damnosus]
MSIFRKLAWFFKIEKWNYLIGVIFLLLVAVLNVLPPKIIGNLVQLISTNKLKATTLTFSLIVLVSVAILQYLFRFGWRSRIFGGAARLEKTLRSRLFTHYMQMDQTFYQEHRTGDLMAHATNDLQAIQQVAGSGILSFADSIITGITTIIAMMVLVDWRLTLLAMIPFPLLAISAGYLGTKIHIAFRKSQAAFSRLNNKTQESVMGIKVIKSLGQDKEDTADFEKLIDQTIKINRKVNALDAMFNPMTTILIGVSYMITLVLGGSFVVHNVINIGQLVSFISYITMLIWPMFAIGNLFNIMERGNASYDRVNLLLHAKSSIIDDKHAVKQRATGDLNFAIQSFTYPGDEQSSLNRVSFKLPAGNTLGLVGKVGTGKSTIMKLILREFDDYKGEITVGGINIKDYALNTYLPSIGYVPEESFLFSDTIKNNIKFGDFSATDEEVIEAAKKSDLYDDILDQPDQFDTEVGEQGVSLSGGQRQRLAIARALIINPEILLLDDALSAVDGETEHEILKELRKERKGKTTIIAAHRLSSVMNANEILVLDSGEIIQRGTHEELLKQDGWYQDMFHRQQMETKIAKEGDLDAE